MQCAVITISDRASQGIYDDRSGPVAIQRLAEAGHQLCYRQIVEDELNTIQAALIKAMDAGALLVLTTGGTGIGPRDITPEATLPLLDQVLDGLAEGIRRRGETHTPFALLSRAVIGVHRQRTHPVLLVNAPGSQGGVKDTLDFLLPLLGHIMSQLEGGDH